MWPTLILKSSKVLAISRKINWENKVKGELRGRTCMIAINMVVWKTRHWVDKQEVTHSLCFTKVYEEVFFLLCFLDDKCCIIRKYLSAWQQLAILRLSLVIWTHFSTCLLFIVLNYAVWLIHGYLLWLPYYSLLQAGSISYNYHWEFWYQLTKILV